MGRRNYLVEGFSGTGKTSVCDELQRRGYQAVHGDRELAYQGDPVTGAALPGHGHEHHIWSVARVGALIADHDAAATFFCGGARNFPKFVDLFDDVFVLQVDLDTLLRRLEQRPDDEWGGTQAQRDQIVVVYRSGGGLPAGTVIDATAPLSAVVDEILRYTEGARQKTDPLPELALRAETPD